MKKWRRRGDEEEEGDRCAAPHCGNNSWMQTPAGLNKKNKKKNNNKKTSRLVGLSVPTCNNRKFWTFSSPRSLIKRSQISPKGELAGSSSVFAACVCSGGVGSFLVFR